MMGSAEMQPNHVEDTIFVAVGKYVKESESTLLWTARNFPGKKICLLHVRQPEANLPTLFNGKLAFNKLEKQLKEFPEVDASVDRLFQQYVLILGDTGVEIDKVWIETENVEEGIVKLVALHGIRWLVMGAAADEHYTKETAEPKSSKAICVCRKALFSCQIWFVCNGCLIYVRECKEDNPVTCISRQKLSSNLEGLKEQAEDEKLHDEIQGLGCLPLVTYRECSSNLLALSSPRSAAEARRYISKDKEDNHLDIAGPALFSHLSLISGTLSGKRAEAAESSCTEEMKQKKASEEALFSHKQEFKRIKDECEEYKKKLIDIQVDSTLLRSQIAESGKAMQELKDKVISAVDLLITFRNRRDQLKIETENATNELKRLRRWKQARDLIVGGPKFCVFSFLEISKATCGFDASKRIGQGIHGSVYQGLLRHTKVAIRMLPNGSSLSDLEFEHEVEVLSRVRHPNLVALIGMCSESRLLVYEFIGRCSLEDHLARRGKRAPLPWKTRVSIATQICSALIFLHKSNPSIVHGNLKPSKILIDSDFVCKIVDLGIFHLAPKVRVLEEWLTAHNNADCSSMDMDPKFHETGEATLVSDVYSFGLILLRLLTGRASFGIVEDVKSALEKDMFGMILDFSAGDWPVSEAETLARLSLLCCERMSLNCVDLLPDLWNVLETMRNLSEVAAACSLAEEQRRPPPHFICPIFQEIMKDPYIAADGFTYEGDAIQGWLTGGHKTSPMTNLKLAHCDLIRNHSLYYAIQDWLRSS